MPTPLHSSDDVDVDVVIVGAGLCGLALARILCARGMQVRVLEARNRLGGRALNYSCRQTGQSLDLGPTWFWPDTETRISALLTALGLSSHAQHDPGDALWLTDPNRPVERRESPGGVVAGAQRIRGGVGRLVQALANTLPSGCVRLNQPVHALHDQITHIVVGLPGGATLRARQVVLAVPPRLLLQDISFSPALALTVQQALQSTPTWMAAQAKAITTFSSPFWRHDGHSGNAYVQHPQAMLAEVFDCSDPPADTEGGVGGVGGAGGANAEGPGALGGFLALNPAQRQHFSRGLPLLLSSQLGQLFGAQARTGLLHYQDWATERWTCSEADRTHPNLLPQSDPLLRQPLWNGRLLLGGSETAAHGAGHMEGALESADRLAHVVLRRRSEVVAVESTAATAHACAEPHRPGRRAAALGSFSAAVLILRSVAAARYGQHLTRLLQAQQTEQITQRALLATAEQTYSEALTQLDLVLPDLDTWHADVLDGRHALTAALLAPFYGWSKGLLDSALAWNAGSCALSNFPQELGPDADSLRAITLDLAAAWREFAMNVNTRLQVTVSHAEATPTSL